MNRRDFSGQGLKGLAASSAAGKLAMAATAPPSEASKLHIQYVRDEPEGDELRVNVLLNRASPWVDVYSHIPYQGKVEVKTKKTFRDVSLRVPEWVESGSAQVKARRGGTAIPLVWAGRYVRRGPLTTGETVTLEFPIETRTVKETMAGNTYTLETSQ